MHSLLGAALANRQWLDQNPTVCGAHNVRKLRESSLGSLTGGVASNAVYSGHATKIELCNVHPPHLGSGVLDCHTTQGGSIGIASLGSPIVSTNVETSEVLRRLSTIGIASETLGPLIRGVSAMITCQCSEAQYSYSNRLFKLLRTLVLLHARYMWPLKHPPRGAFSLAGRPHYLIATCTATSLL